MKKAVIVSVGTLVTCLLLCVGLFQALVYGCLPWECAPQKAFQALDLDLPADLFPPGATVNSLSRLSEGGGTIENGLKSVFWGNYGSGIANYEVLRFPSARQATEIFGLEKRGFADKATKEIWKKPSALTFVSHTADEFFIGCGNWSDYRCGMIVRYDEYILEFNAVIDPEMTYQRFEDIIRYIDTQISDRLSR